MFKAAMKRLSPKFQMFTGVHELRKGNAIIQAQEYDRLKAQVGARTPENIALAGYKVYSQTDEDGILDAIFRRIPSRNTFVEIGVQTGVECNSLLLLLKGWRGAWIEGSEAYCRQIVGELGTAEFPRRFRVTRSFVERDNIVSLLRAEMQFLKVDELDLLSIDIDGNVYQPFRYYLSPIMPAQPPSLSYLRDRLLAQSAPAAAN